MTPAQIERPARGPGRPRRPRVRSLGRRRRPGRARPGGEGRPLLRRRAAAATAPAVPVPAALPAPDPRGKPLSTQMAFGQILTEIARTGGPLAERIVTTAPDVTVSTNLGGWVNRRGLYARDSHGRHLQGRAHSLDLRLGVLARRPALRARHRRGEPDDHALGPRPLAPDQRRAAAAGRHRLRPLRAPRRRPAQLRLLPGRALPPRRHALRASPWRPRAGRTSRSPRPSSAWPRTASPPSSRPSPTSSR